MSSAVAVLTAMITPAVLISACGSMILSTSTRLGRVVDRVRALSDKLEELAAKSSNEVRETTERQAIIFAQLDKHTPHLRGTVGPQYDSRGDGFHLETNHESGSC